MRRRAPRANLWARRLFRQSGDGRFGRRRVGTVRAKLGGIADELRTFIRRHRAVRVDGTADFPAGNKPQTISLWVWYASTAGTQAIVTLRSDFASGLVLGIRDGTLGAFMVNPLTGGTLVAIETPPPPQTWIHVAYVYDGSTASLYVNGAVAATNAVSANIQIPTTSWLGTLDGYSQFFAGEMDEIRIWSVARKPSDILADMQGTVASNAPGLVAYFDCNEACGTRMPDESGNGNDATLGGGDPAFMPQLVAADVPPDS